MGFPLATGELAATLQGPLGLRAAASQKFPDRVLTHVPVPLAFTEAHFNIPRPTSVDTGCGTPAKLYNRQPSPRPMRQRASGTPQRSNHGSVMTKNKALAD